MQGAEKPVEDIVRDLRRGRDREENFRLLFLRYHGQVCRFFLRKGLPQEDARDLTQEVFFSVHKGLMTLQGEAQFTGWLFTIARNAYVNHLERQHARKREGRSEAFDLDVLPSAGRGALAEMLDREQVAQMKEALGELPGQMRRCVQLRVVDDHSYDEIAVLMGISINTVKAHLFKARQVLREKLLPSFGEVEI